MMDEAHAKASGPFPLEATRSLPMKTFEVGKTYTCRSICDYECIYSFEILKRTDRSVWIRVPQQGDPSTSAGRFRQHRGDRPSRTLLDVPILRAALIPTPRAAKAVAGAWRQKQTEDLD